MTELNKYSFYGLNFTNAKQVDELDEFVNNIVQIKDYEQVKELLENKWHLANDIEVIDYPKLNKQVILNITEERIEVRVYKDTNQEFGQYWQIISSTKE